MVTRTELRLNRLPEVVRRRLGHSPRLTIEQEMLREIAFVLSLTQRLREEMAGEEPGAEKAAAEKN